MTYKSYKFYDDSMMDGHIVLFVWKTSKKNTWWCRISVPNKKGYVIGQRSLKTTSKPEAQDMARTLYLSEYEKSKAGYAAGTTTWTKMFDKYMLRFKPTEKINSTSDQLKDEWLNERYFQKYFGKFKVEDIQPEDVLGYLDWRITYWAKKRPNEKKVAQVWAKEPHRNTIRKEVYTLKRIFDLAREEGRIKWQFPDRAVGRRLKPLRTGSNRGRFSPYEGKRDYDDWVSLKKSLYTRRKQYRGRYEDSRGRNKSYHPDVIAANERLICFMNIMVNVGMRPHELLWMKWDDVRVREEKETIDGVKIKYKYTLFDIRQEVSKTNVARTAVAANGIHAWTHLMDWKSICEEYGYPTDASALIFAKKRDFEVPNDLPAYFRKTLMDLNLHDDSKGNKRSLYSFRHLFIDYAVKENRPIKAVRDNCGTSIRMLNDYYMSNNAWDMRHYLIRKGFYERAVKQEKNKTVSIEVEDTKM